MKELIIVGAGGFARELLQWVKDINKIENRWVIKGFIDDNPNALKGYDCDFQVIGNIQDWKPSENEEFALAIAAPKIKEKVVKILKSKNARFADIIHPNARICEFSIHGEGIVMYPGSALCPNSKVGNFVTLLSSPIPHDAVVGDYATISSHCGITRGNYIGRRSFLGDHVSIMPEKKIGDDAYVGIGSVVIRNVPSGKKVFGNPAKVIDI